MAKRKKNRVTIAYDANATKFIKHVKEAEAKFRAAMAGITASVGKANKQIAGGMSSITRHASNLKNAIAGVWAYYQVTRYVKELGRVADEYTNVTAKLDLAADSQEEFSSSMEAMFKIAQESRTGLTDVVNLYSRLRTAQKDQNVTQEDTIKLTETMVKAMKVSGATQSETASTMLQMTQAFSSGVLRGEEFNSMMGQGPRLAKALADGLGVPMSALRKMAQAGEITASRLSAALIGQAGKIGKEYEKLPVTIQGAVTKLSNEWLRYVGTADKATGASKDVAKSIETIASHLDDIAAVAMTAGKVLFAAFAIKAAGAMRTYVASAIVARNTTIALGAASTAAAAKVGLLSKVANTAFAAFAGWEIGSYFKTEFETVEKAGIIFARTIHSTLATISGSQRREIQKIKDEYMDMFNLVGAGHEKVAEIVSKSEQRKADAMKKQADAAAILVAQLNGIDALQKIGIINDDLATENKKALIAAYEKQSGVMKKSASDYEHIANRMIAQINAAKTLSAVNTLTAKAQWLLAGNTEQMGRAMSAAAERTRAFSSEYKKLLESLSGTAPVDVSPLEGLTTSTQKLVATQRILGEVAGSMRAGRMEDTFEWAKKGAAALDELEESGEVSAGTIKRMRKTIADVMGEVGAPEESKITLEMAIEEGSIETTEAKLKEIQSRDRTVTFDVQINMDNIPDSIIIPVKEGISSATQGYSGGSDSIETLAKQRGGRT
ncbi:MAG: tape measure protein [Desulfobulbaceae bacterium]|nr:tape measure protein [Desulfobulbaceae bacterium]